MIFNPNGQLKAEDYSFPYADDSFDTIYAASVFTHLLPSSSANYFKQSRRVLRKGGQCLFSFFVLDWYRGPGTPIDRRYEVNHPLEGYEGVAVYDDKRPEHIIAYSTSCIERMASDARLRIKRLIPGYWSNAHKWSLNEQDLVLLEAV